MDNPKDIAKPFISKLDITEFVGPKYNEIANESLNTTENNIKDLLSQRNLPKEGWSPQKITTLINKLSLMDSNNYEGSSHIGEREGRIYSEIISSRHFRLSHGIGRTGDLKAIQPKAIGSSVMHKLTYSLVKNALKYFGLNVKHILLLPMATGMSIMMIFLALKQLQQEKLGIKPQQEKQRIIIISRVDHKSPIKSIITAGLQPIIVDTIQIGDELSTNLEGIENIIQEKGADSILGILSCNSCFAPRVPDDLVGISKVCKKYGLYHICNNAFGLQSTISNNNILQANKIYPITAIISSFDKNFMVPVGAALVYSLQKRKSYPGRASGSNILDMLITLLQMGESGIINLLKERKELHKQAREKVNEIVSKYGERVLKLPKNNIGIAISLKNTQLKVPNIVDFGAYLLKRRVFGMKVVAENLKPTIIGKDLEIINFMSHTENYTELPYCTFAVSIGTLQKDLDLFYDKLDMAFRHFHTAMTLPMLIKTEVKTEDMPEEERKI